MNFNFFQQFELSEEIGLRLGMNENTQLHSFYGRWNIFLEVLHRFGTFCQVLILPAGYWEVLWSWYFYLGGHCMNFQCPENSPRMLTCWGKDLSSSPHVMSQVDGGQHWRRIIYPLASLKFVFSRDHPTF